MVDAPDLGSGVERRVGSSPTICIVYVHKTWLGLSLVREDYDDGTSGLPVVFPKAWPERYVSSGEHRNLWKPSKTQRFLIVEEHHTMGFVVIILKK